jgi:hypothetical protein
MSASPNDKNASGRCCGFQPHLALPFAVRRQRNVQEINVLIVSQQP